MTIEASKLAFGMTKKSKHAIAQTVVHLTSFELRIADAPSLITTLERKAYGISRTTNLGEAIPITKATREAQPETAASGKTVCAEQTRTTRA